jgi:hypothetical protein
MKSIGVIIHTYMEISQGNSLYSSFISNKKKCHFFLFSLFLYKIREKEGGEAPGGGFRGRGKWQGKEIGG